MGFKFNRQYINLCMSLPKNKHETCEINLNCGNNSFFVSQTIYKPDSVV